MKIVVLNNGAPFQRGGAEHLAEALVQQLEQQGHRAELIRLPFRWDTPRAVAWSMYAALATRLSNCDRVIALKFPAYLVPFDDKVIWLLHQYRQVYDLWASGRPADGYPPDYERLRGQVHEADRLCFAKIQRIFSNSVVTANRLLRFTGVGASVLHPPLANSGQYRAGAYGNYLLAVGRVTAGKRQAMAVEAMAHSQSGVRMLVVGQPETTDDLKQLEAIIDRHGLADRVELMPRYVTEEDKVRLLAGALGVVYLPYDEDSYGYVTAESFLSEKPVITTIDAGGVLELVVDGTTGLVVKPDTVALGAAFDELAETTGLAERLGRSGHDALDRLDLSWDHVVGVLTS